jgi:hypothetical protein
MTKREILSLIRDVLKGNYMADPTAECSCCASKYVSYDGLMTAVENAIADATPQKQPVRKTRR